MTTYKGYFNYYLGGILKTYHFDKIPADLVLAIENLLRLRCTVWVGALLCKQTLNERREEIAAKILDFKEFKLAQVLA